MRLIEYLSSSGMHHRVAEGAAARQDRDLRHGVGVVHRRRREGVSALVVGRDELLLVFHDAGATLRAGDHAVDGLVEGAVVDELRVRARREQRGLVEHVREVGTGEAGGLAREHLEVDALGERLALGVHLEDLLAALEVGGVDADLAVEAARAQQRRVEDVGAVRRRDEDDVGLRVEAVHLDEQLVEGLLALVVPAAESGAAVTADGVDLVDEDDGRGVLLGLVEEVANAGSRRRRRTSRRSPIPRSSRTARPPHPRPRGRAGSCRFREGRRAARPWGCARRPPGTSRAPSGTP